MSELGELLSEAWTEIEELEQEIQRLKAGKFTPEELQNLCHNLPEEDKQAFKQGCSDYQKQLCGSSTVEDERSKIVAYLKKQADDLRNHGWMDEGNQLSNAAENIKWGRI